ncbi:hypothetical protein [Paludisphaera sp.]|uniref:hypothetical protein n=1 Tax=Paludisphaera sp. TaxID=2017432 RepID=UPI00301C14C6
MPTRQEDAAAVEGIQRLQNQKFSVDENGPRPDAEGRHTWNAMTPDEHIALMKGHLEWKGFDEEQRLVVIENVLAGGRPHQWTYGVAAGETPEMNNEYQVWKPTRPQANFPGDYRHVGGFEAESEIDAVTRSGRPPEFGDVVVSPRNIASRYEECENSDDRFRPMWLFSEDITPADPVWDWIVEDRRDFGAALLGMDSPSDDQISRALQQQNSAAWAVREDEAIWSRYDDYLAAKEREDFEAGRRDDASRHQTPGSQEPRDHADPPSASSTQAASEPYDPAAYARPGDTKEKSRGPER